MDAELPTDPLIAGSHQIILERLAESGPVSLPILEEVISVTKRVVDQAGYQITKRVDSEQVNVDELLQREEVSIERRLIGLTLDADEIPVQRQEGDVLVIPVVREILVTEKRLVLVEEIRISRIRSSYCDPQEVTLRKETVLVEQLKPNSQSVQGTP